ncbi:MAG: dienelactone hydrolase family protein [Vulcanimicrobiaceae bacterium]
MRSKVGVAIPVSIPSGKAQLNGDLTLVDDAQGLVLFVHGSGSSRFSTRNRRVARALNDGGLATLLADLLTPEEEAVDAHTAALRFDIPMLAERTVRMIDWARSHESVDFLPVGLFGASTGAAAAIIAASRRPNETSAVVSRGGRVDLAGSSLDEIRAPLLMIVGGLDFPVIDLHRSVLPRIKCEHHYVVIPGATHLFEEPGALDAVADLATGWFQQHLTI